MIYIAILIFILLILIAASEIQIHIKSVEDTIKVDAKIGIFSFLVPHQKIITKMIEKEKSKTRKEQTDDFFSAIGKRGLLLEVCKHSTLSQLYMARFTKEQLHQNPMMNGIYWILSGQVKGFAVNHFKLVEESSIQLVYDHRYENVDYYIGLRTDVISLLTAIIKSKLKGK